MGVTARAVEDVERHGGPSVTRQKLRDHVVAIGPVALHDGDSVLCKQQCGGLGFDHRPFVGLAGQAPVGGEVDEDRRPRLRQGHGLGLVEGLPVEQRRRLDTVRAAGRRAHRQVDRHGAEDDHRQRCDAVCSGTSPKLGHGPHRQRHGQKRKLDEGESFGADLGGEYVEEPDRGGRQQKSEHLTEGVHPGPRLGQELGQSGRHRQTEVGQGQADTDGRED